MNNKLKVGLNGLGRIGRHIFKMCIEDPMIELVGINEVNPDLNNWAYTLNYDSIYGQSKYKVEVENKKIICNKKSIFTSMHKNFRKDSEIRFNQYFKRSIYLKKNVKKGDIISKENITTLRPLLGLNALNYFDVIGKKFKKNLKENHPLKSHDIY